MFISLRLVTIFGGQVIVGCVLEIVFTVAHFMCFLQSGTAALAVRAGTGIPLAVVKVADVAGTVGGETTKVARVASKIPLFATVGMKQCVIFTARKRSWGKVMFLHRCVILFTGQGYDVTSLWSHILSKGVWSRGFLVPGVGRHYPPPTTHKSGQYASYWNAFLLTEYFFHKYSRTIFYVLDELIRKKLNVSSSYRVHNKWAMGLILPFFLPF